MTKKPEMSDNHLAATTKTDLVIDSGYLEMSDTHLPTTTTDLVRESGGVEMSDNHLAATKKTDLVIDSGYLEMHDTHLPTTTNDLVRESGGVEMNDNHLPTTVTDCCSPHSRMNIEKQNLSKKKRKKRQHEYGGGKKKKKQQTTNKNQDANGTAVACYECGIVEHSYEDNQLSEDWIQCCKTGCNTWCHESCGEKGGILDDAEFFCAKCALTI
jgi:hypothetical protein